MEVTPLFKSKNPWKQSYTPFSAWMKINSAGIDDIIDFKFAEFLIKEGFNE